MKNFLIALQFLTILPVKIRQDIEEKDFGKSLLFFPVVGVIIGVILALSAGTFYFIPKPVLSALIIIVSVIVSGGIHLDGFADTCDAFYGQKSKQKILEIMRDSRIGVMGAAGIVCLFLLKYTLILSIPESILLKSLILMAAFSRWAMVWGCYISAYPRQEGKGKYFIEYAGKNEFFMGTFFIIALFLLLMGLKGVVLFSFSLVPVFLFINWTKRKIGGMTGDTIGATSEIAEVGVLFFTVCSY